VQSEPAQGEHPQDRPPGVAGSEAVSRIPRIPKVAELVADVIRAQIVSGELREGDALDSEAVLLDRFGVSRGTLREAMRMLEADSLISTTRGVRGAQVHTPSPRGLIRGAALLLQYQGAGYADLYRALGAIEATAIEELIARQPADAFDELDALNEQAHAVIDDPRAHAEEALRFHQRLVELTGNRTLTLFSSIANEIVRSVRIPRARPGNPHVTRWDAEHHDVVRLMRERRTGEALGCWRAHIESNFRALEHATGDDEVDLFKATAG
jgi:DNA-binding FadR family transcriptional regulator